MVRNSKKIRAEQIINSVQPKTSTEKALVSKTIFGTFTKTLTGTTTISIFTCPDGYRFKVTSIQHTIYMLGTDDYSISYCYTDDLNVTINQNNVISFVQCDFNNNQAVTLNLSEPYIILEKQVVKLNMFCGAGITRANVIVSLLGYLEPLND